MHNNRVVSIFEVFELATFAQNDQLRKHMGFRMMVGPSNISLMYYDITPLKGIKCVSEF